MRRSILVLCLLTIATATVGQGVEPSQLFAFSCVGTNQFKNCPNGGRPEFIFEASDGNFYGAAQTSQEGFSTPAGGTIFKVTSTGTFTRLFTFVPGTNNSYPDGNLPASLVEGSDGNLYGTTAYGGSYNVGVLFRLSMSGSGFKILHQFCSQKNCADGFFGGIGVATPEGILYGTTGSGGKIYRGYGCGSIYFPTGCGTFFKFNIATGAYSVVYALNPATDGLQPEGVFQASDGSFYGFDVGNDITNHIFRFTLSGSFRVIYTTAANFLISIPLAEGANGNLYSIIRKNDGTSPSQLFEIDRDGSNFRTIASLTAVNTSTSGFLVPSDGNLWGLSFDGGGKSRGAVLKISPTDGAVLQTFAFNGKNGAYPDNLMQVKSGLLVGTASGRGTVSGGTADGVVFSLNANLSPPLK